MVGGRYGGVPGSLALLARQGRWWRFSWRLLAARSSRWPADHADGDDASRRLSRFRYHLGRGRRAREAGRFEQGVAEARRALALNPSEPWALALLGQCLYRQRASDLSGARRALERAWALDPTNGYFVSLLLDVLNAQGDPGACLDLLTWAWWRGAAVERWLPDGPPMRVTGGKLTRPDPGRVGERPASPAVPVPARRAGTPPPLSSRQPVHAYGR